jgi:hypothetical protein
VILGASYGVFVRWGMRATHSTLITVMSIAFVFLIPFTMGFVSVFTAERESSRSVAMWVFLPWIPVLLGSAASLVFLWEGWICVLMFIPVALGWSSIGGLVAGGVVHMIRSRTARNMSAACILILPLTIGPWERNVFTYTDLRTIETPIDITAPPEVIWRNIERVPVIRPVELRPSWSRRIGFPAPVEATLSYEGIGGVRHATFAGGVLFIETIDIWEPERRLAFSIKAQGDQIPPTTLDEHVKVGGPYFDVLRGQYVLEPLGNGVTRLHLSSQHRVSTDFNWYARLWTDTVMRDLQNTILQVIQKRCETEARNQHVIRSANGNK